MSNNEPHISINGLFDKQKAIINAIVKSSAKFHILNASRQSSKTFSLSKLLIIFALTVNTEKILSVSPSYDQARIIYDNIINTDNIESLIKTKKTSKPYEITFLNNTTIYFKSAERYDNIRGGSYKYVVCDEFSFFRNGVFDTVIRPTTAAKRNSKIVLASTPKGKYNDFYLYASLGQSEDENYIYYQMHYSENPYYDLKEIEDARKRLPQNIFNQEYEAIFIDSGGDVFEDISKIATINTYDYKQGTKYYGGVDWGRADDSTVITILNSNKEVSYMKSFKGDWNKQIKDLSLILNKYKPIVFAESNGIGDPLIVQLKKEYSNVKSFMTTNSSKREIVEQLRMDMFNEDIKLPTLDLCPDLHKELSNFTYSISKSGNIMYHHSDGGNDDFVDSLAIANYAHNKHSKSFTNYHTAKRSDFY